MRVNKLNFILTIITITCHLAFSLYVPAVWAEAKKWSDEGVVTKQGKKYPHPHALHLEAGSQRSADFSADEIKEWQVFLQSLQNRLNVLPFGAEAKLYINNLKPASLNVEIKTDVVNQINKLLFDKRLPSLAKEIIAFSSETKKLESDYNKTKNMESLRWLNRSIINDLFPQTFRIKKISKLQKITCVTCHEMGIQKVGLKEAVVNEKAVLDCFSKAIAGEKGFEECIEKSRILKESKIQSYGPLKLFVQKTDINGENSFNTAIHPENPYTFKPILKRNVCIECHSQERKVNKVMGSDGKVKEIPVFYGVGSEKRQTH